jgi:hypothetical protein
MLRRLTALVSSLLMLQLSFAAGDLACATHDSERSSATHQHSDHGASASAAMHHASDAVDASKSCRVPARGDCCAALVSCGPSIGIATTITTQDIQSIYSRIDLPISELPASPTAAPEPPPPKA